MNDPVIDSDILGELDRRGVTEARHFTTNRGLLGVLRTQKLLSRKDLAQEQILELIAMNNCFRRWDNQWFGYVNLSIQRINGYLYDISSGNWHLGEDLWWTVLGFDRVVLAHEGVYFTTTNNGYWSVVKRETGLHGLTALYADEIASRDGNSSVTLKRTAHGPNQPTDPQAEALYPAAVDTRWLRTIYVPQPDLADTVSGYLEATGHPLVTVRYDPEAFA